MKKESKEMIPVSLSFDDSRTYQFSVHEKAMQMIEEALQNRKKHLFALIAESESPIEQMLILAIHERLQFLGEEEVYLCPQTPIGKYRVDLLIQIIHDIPPEYAAGMVNIVVECDGHDYHERTKEQAKRDKERDRFLQSQGYIVLRFTGSEIWNDPVKCAREVVDLVYSKRRELRNANYDD